MKMTALIEREGDGYVSLCPELISQAKATPSNPHGTICVKRWNFFSSPLRRKKSSNGSGMRSLSPRWRS